jgi:ssDNA-binding replication factor A large subunit
LGSYLKIEELVPNSPIEEIKLRIISKNGPRMVGSTKRKSFVTDLLVIDNTGDSCSFTVWGKDESEKYKVGKLIELRNGWCKEYMGMKQISIGRNGMVTFYENDDPAFPRSIKEENQLREYEDF